MKPLRRVRKPTAWHWCPEPETMARGWTWALRACDLAMTRLRAEAEAQKAKQLAAQCGVEVR